MLKAEDIFNCCASEFIDALVVVADNAEVLITACEQRGEQILSVVGVLILVNHYVAEFALIIAEHLVVRLQQAHGVDDDIVEVHGVRSFKTRLI